MKVLRGTQPLAELQFGAAVTIGNFDGVHRGHQALLAELRMQATRLKLPTLVVLFEPQPREYFQQDKAPARLMTRREKLESLAQCGIDYVYCLTFNEALALMSPEKFSECFIFSLFRAKYVLVGEDFHFGCNRRGDVALLRALSAPWSCMVETYRDFSEDALRVSSTQIRLALRLGELQRAARLLGQPFCISGRVVQGAGLGRQWGIPTANVRISHQVLPLTGVFCVRVRRADQSEHWGVANVGVRPTVGGVSPVLEVHLFDFDDSLYHERIHVFFLQRLREEIKFSSLDALIAQIRADLVEAIDMRPHLMN